MNKNWLIAVALSGAGAALAQDSGVSVSVGARAWYAEWSTFSSFPPNGPVDLALTQEPANSKLVLMPVVGVRYGDFSASISAMPSTDFMFVSGGGNRRQELDLNLGYDVISGLTLTLGYKKVSQTDLITGGRYRPSGPVVGLSGNAPLSGPWSLYGSLGVGKFKTPAGDSIDFKADYRLTELGLAYTLYGNQFVKRWTFTAGYRIQVLTSKEAFIAPNGGLQDGVDTTQGFTLGAIATF